MNQIKYIGTGRKKTNFKNFQNFLLTAIFHRTNEIREEKDGIKTVIKCYNNNFQITRLLGIPTCGRADMQFGGHCSENSYQFKLMSIFK